MSAGLQGDVRPELRRPRVRRSRPLRVPTQRRSLQHSPAAPVRTRWTVLAPPLLEPTRGEPEAEASIESLAEDVMAQVHIPVDTWAVAATLESLGLRDVDAPRYGETDIFTLAERVHKECRDRLTGSDVSAPAVYLPSPRTRMRQFGRHYLRGILSSLPMFVQTLSILVAGFALWSYLRFDTASASVVSMGTIWSFVVTGGFVQVIGRMGRFYLQQDAYRLAEQVCWRGLRAGASTTVVLGVPFLVLAATGTLPDRLAFEALTYYLLLSALWLVFAILYTVDRPMLIVGCISFGIGVIWLARTASSLDIFWAQWVGLGSTVALAGYLARRALRAKSALVTGTGLLSELPRRSLLTYLASPYFLYGTLYFTFLYVDRVVAWTVGSHPVFIWFDTPYEIGLDVALLALVLMLAQLEYTIQIFSDSVVIVQEAFGAESRQQHNLWFQRFYLKQVGWLVVIASGSILMVYVVVMKLGDYSPSLAAVLDDPVMQSVYWFAAVGYAWVVVGLLNCIFLFSLSRVGFALRALTAGLVVNVVVGVWLSRTLDYWCAVVGLTVGAAVFAVVSGYYTVHVLRRLDYYYYSAS